MKVLVVTARGLQAGALAAYGNSWIDTPALDALAADGIVFDRHLADVADPAGARHAWRTGRYHFSVPGGSQPSVPSQQETDERTAWDLLQALREKNVYAVLIADQSHPAPAEFALGWDKVVGVVADKKGYILDAMIAAARSALRTLAQRDEWLLWVDMGIPLLPWNVPDVFLTPYFQEETDEEADEDDAEIDDENETEPPEEETPAPFLPLLDPSPSRIDPDDDVLFLRIQSTYAGAVSYLDAGVGKLLDTLTKAGVAEETLIVFTGDVGQALGEHGVLGFDPPLAHEEVIHVPLIVRLPHRAEAGRRVAGLTQALDLAPTLAEVFGVATGKVHGHSLWPLFVGKSDKVRDHAVAGYRVGDAAEYCLRTPEWAFLLPITGRETTGRQPQLFVKPDDRWEVNDVRQHHLEVSEELERTLRQFLTTMGDVPSSD